MKVEEFVAYATITCFGLSIDFTDYFELRTCNGCNCKTSATPWAENVPRRVPSIILDSIVRIPEDDVMKITRHSVRSCRKA